MTQFPQWQKEHWEDASGNPLVGYFEGEKKKFAIGDPQVIQPGEFDDGWHMFYHGFYENFKPYYHHLISADGWKWELKNKWQWDVGPSSLFYGGDRWFLYYTNVVSEQPSLRTQYAADMIISAKWTFDFEHWSEPFDVLAPSLPWETEGKKVEARNPCMVKVSDTCYRLYYSAGNVWLDLCDYEEPKYVSFADAPTPFGPFIKYGEPILAPRKDCVYRNFGAGGFKVFGYKEKLLAIYNPIYLEEQNIPRSALAIALSQDGVHWEDAPFNPIIVPDEGTSWKKAIVYQLDLALMDDELRLYYNARDEWLEGIERIGCSVYRGRDRSVRKLWDNSQAH